MLQPGPNSTSWSAAWNSGKTRTIRVPVRLADDILAYARALDSGIDVEQQLILKAIDRFVECRIAAFRPNQYSRVASTNSRRWDELKKFRNLVATDNRQADELKVESQPASVHH